MVTNSIYRYNYFIISTVENVTNVKNSINCYNSIGAYVHFCGNLEKLRHFSFPANEILFAQAHILCVGNEMFSCPVLGSSGKKNF